MMRVADLLRELRQLLAVELAQIGGVLMVSRSRHGGCGASQDRRSQMKRAMPAR